MYAIIDTIDGSVFKREEDLILAKIDAYTNFPDGKVEIIDEDTGLEVKL